MAANMNFIWHAKIMCMSCGVCIMEVQGVCNGYVLFTEKNSKYH